MYNHKLIELAINMLAVYTAPKAKGEGYENKLTKTSAIKSF